MSSTNAKATPFIREAQLEAKRLFRHNVAFKDRMRDPPTKPFSLFLFAADILLKGDFSHKYSKLMSKGNNSELNFDSRGRPKTRLRRTYKICGKNSKTLDLEFQITTLRDPLLKYFCNLGYFPIIKLDIVNGFSFLFLDNNLKMATYHH